jgi:hypothetical protein
MKLALPQEKVPGRGGPALLGEEVGDDLFCHLHAEETQAGWFEASFC